MQPNAPKSPNHSNERRNGQGEGGNGGHSVRSGKAAVSDWMHRLDEALWAPPDAATHGISLFLRRWLQIIQRSLVGFFRHNATNSATSLTYATLLSIVPLLAMLMALLTVFGAQESVRDSLKQYPLIQNLTISSAASTIPGKLDVSTTATLTTPTQGVAMDDAGTTPPSEAASAGPPDGQPRAAEEEPAMTGPKLVDTVFDFVDNARLTKLGPFGFVGLLWAVVVLLTKIELAMNRAWGVKRQRTISRKIADYLHILIVGTLILLALTTTTSSKVIGALQRVSESHAAGQFQALVPAINQLERFVLGNIAYLIIWPAFVIIYAFIPNTAVRWRSAIAGGLVAGTLYQLIQIAFILLSGHLFRRYGTIYGSFAIVFVMLIWISISWMILLWGAEVCASHQNLRDLRRARREWRDLPVERETLALRLAGLLAAPLVAGDEGRAMDAGDLADALCCPPEPLNEMLELFRDHGLLVESADDQTYRLARTPGRLTVLDILRLVRQGTMKPPSGPHAADLEGEHPSLGRFGDETIEQLAHLPVEQIQTLHL